MESSGYYKILIRYPQNNWAYGIWKQCLYLFYNTSVLYVPTDNLVLFYDVLISVIAVSVVLLLYPICFLCLLESFLTYSAVIKKKKMLCLNSSGATELSFVMGVLMGRTLVVARDCLGSGSPSSGIAHCHWHRSTSLSVVIYIGFIRTLWDIVYLWT